MLLYFDLIPDELFVIIIYYVDIDEVRDDKYLRDNLIGKWSLLFTFSFPDIYLNLIDNIDYSSQDFDYFYWIYLHIKQSYDSVKYNIEHNISRKFIFSLLRIRNLNLKQLLINKEPILKDLRIYHTIRLIFSDNKFKLEVHGLPKAIELIHKEGLIIAVHLLYNVLKNK